MSRDRLNKVPTPEVKKQTFLWSTIKRKADEFDTYGTHVANQLRQIEDRKKVAHVRFKIDEIIFNAICEVPLTNVSFSEASAGNIKPNTAVEEPTKKKN